MNTLLVLCCYHGPACTFFLYPQSVRFATLERIRYETRLACLPFRNH